MNEEMIYARMVESILNHRLPPGTKLIEDRLATAFGVSRTRIRPVLVRLANEQIVTLTLNRGATVAQPTQAEALEVFEVRRMIEPTLITRFIAVARDQDIEVLSRCIEQEEGARQAGDHRRAIRLSGEFHLHMASACQHQTLGRILRELVSRTSLVLMAYGHMTPRSDACGCQEHRGLLAAIRLRDAQAASRLMQEHLRQLESQLQFAAREAEAPDLLALFANPCDAAFC